MGITAEPIDDCLEVGVLMGCEMASILSFKWKEF